MFFFLLSFLITAEGRETKKRTTLARLLKGLKTVNRRDRTNNQNTSTQARVSLHYTKDLFISFKYICMLNIKSEIQKDLIL